MWTKLQDNLLPFEPGVPDAIASELVLNTNLENNYTMPSFGSQFAHQSLLRCRNGARALVPHGEGAATELSYLLGPV